MNAESEEIFLQGTPVNLTDRSQFRERKTLYSPIMSTRSYSTISDIQSYKKGKSSSSSLKRPLSADTIFLHENKVISNKEITNNNSMENINDNLPIKDCDDLSSLPSSQLFKALLSEPLTPTSNPKRFVESTSTSSETNSVDSALESEESLGAKIKELAQRTANIGELLPGITTKPPLPDNVRKKNGNMNNSLHLDLYPDNYDDENLDSSNENEKDLNLNDNNCVLVDLEEISDKYIQPTNQEQLDIPLDLLSESGSNISFQNWLQENKNLMLETKLLETQTDIELQNLHMQQEEYSESFYKDYNQFEMENNNNKEGKLKKSNNNVKDARNKLNNFEETKTNNKIMKKNQTKPVLPSVKSTKKPTKSILKPVLKPKKSVSSPKDSSEKLNDNVNSWMTKNAKHENFLDFLNKLDDLEQLQINSNKEIMEPYMQDIPEHDQDENAANSTCDEIASILEVLEKEDLKSQRNIESLKEILHSELNTNSSTNTAKHTPDLYSNSSSSLDSTPNYNEVLSYLDEVNQSCMKSLKNTKERSRSVKKISKGVLNIDTLPKLEDLLNYSNVDLAHYVLDVSLRLKEKSSGITTLQQELSKLRNLVNTKVEEYDKNLKQKLKEQKEEFEAVIKRHQKFIDQLIADKKSLNQQCEGLISEMKILEDRYNTNLKALEQRHKIDLQKAKDMHMAAEKLRREKWIEGKTQKIKEMTVKGLEPELQNMAARHQQELSDLRSLHKREIEDLELRAARKTQQQCEALRQQLSNEREVAIAHERDILRQRMEKMVESEEKGYQEQRRRLNAEHSARLAECEERIAVVACEKERAIEAAKVEFEDKLNTALRRHKGELKNLKESMDLEFEVWKTNYKKQQSLKMSEIEGQLREACKRERDREIEMVIERLEKEAIETKEQTEQAAENRLRRIKEKFEEEIKDLEKLVDEYKSKYSETKEKLLSQDDIIIDLKTSMKQLQTQFDVAKQLSEELNMDKNKMKEQLKEEFITEIKTLQDEIKLLKNSRDDEMQRIFSKVKMTVARKDELLTELTNSNANLQEKCTLLENLLEQQRKDYLIK